MVRKQLKNCSKTVKGNSKKEPSQAILFGVKLNGTQGVQLLEEIIEKVRKNQKAFVVTPNPEFMVFAHKNPDFKKLLNSADYAIADGMGLVIADRFLAGVNLSRFAGADLAALLLDLAQENTWSVGVVGARRGEKSERSSLIGQLQVRYPRAKIISLEDTPGWQKLKMELVFACHGMGEQEQWIVDNFFKKSRGLVFLGAGGSLDFLTGFKRRAPMIFRKIGLEWLWRGLLYPSHFRRLWTAVVVFTFLVLKEKLGGSK